MTPREPRPKQILPKHGYDFETKGYQPLIEDDLAENLPPNWTARRDRVSGRRYFIDGISKRATWIDPRYLPENWDQRVNLDRSKFLLFSSPPPPAKPYVCPKMLLLYRQIHVHTKLVLRARRLYIKEVTFFEIVRDNESCYR